jgi:hypothetical protein
VLYSENDERVVRTYGRNTQSFMPT